MSGEFVGGLQTSNHLTRHLKPGGYLELQEFDLPLSDDGTLRPDQPLHQSMKYIVEAAEKVGSPFMDITKLKGKLEALGFVDVKQVPYKWPSNTWPKNKKYKEIGAWNHENIKSGISGFMMAAMTRGLGWTKGDVDILAARAKRDLADRSIHCYWPM